MSTVTPPGPPPGPPSAYRAANTPSATYANGAGAFHFWMRRIHSVAGIIFGGYIALHLIVNFMGWWPLVYQQNVDKIYDLEPNLPLIEIVFIFLPLVIHMLWGIYRATVNLNYATTTHYSYWANKRYVLQRITSFILLVFIIYHVGTLTKWGFWLIGLQAAPAFHPHNLAYQSTAQALKTPYSLVAANIAVIVLYLLGIWSAVFHFANGLWTAAIVWGLTVTRAAQRRWLVVCGIFFVLLMIIGTGAWAAFCIGGRPNLPASETFTRTQQPGPQMFAPATGGAAPTGALRHDAAHE